MYNTHDTAYKALHMSAGMAKCSKPSWFEPKRIESDSNTLVKNEKCISDNQQKTVLSPNLTCQASDIVNMARTIHKNEN